MSGSGEAGQTDRRLIDEGVRAPKKGGPQESRNQVNVLTSKMTEDATDVRVHDTGT